MAENYFFEKKTEAKNGWIYIFVLFASFIWTSLYSATSALTSEFYFNFGNLLNASSPNFSSIVLVVCTDALVGLLAFELIFYLYRFILQFKIYSFIVPSDRLKNESRIFYICRNIFYGLFVNLCFICPYLYIYAPLMSLITTFVMLIIYANHLNKTYAEPIIGHFVFKNFCYPIFVYQAIMLIIDIIEVL